MSLAGFTIAVATIYAGFWALYLLFLPMLAFFQREGIARTRVAARPGLPCIGVIIPAHDMEQHVERCVTSIRASDYPLECIEIFVVADHCHDRTEDVARAAGATVLVRDTGPRGKTYTLAWTFEELANRRVDVEMYVVVDATARVASDFLSVLARQWSWGEDIIIGRSIADPENQKWFARCLGLALSHRNLQDWVRDRLGLSALVSGRGMAYSHDYIQKHRWTLALPDDASTSPHPTEDFRHGVRIVEHGYRAAFANDAYVFTPLRDSFGAATKQGLRWEKGRIGNVKSHAWRLLLAGICERKSKKVLAALDAIQPPVAVLMVLCGTLSLVALTYVSSTTAIGVVTAPLILVVIYSVMVLRQGVKEGISVTTFIWAPVYLAWRMMAFLLALTGMDRFILKRRVGSPD